MATKLTDPASIDLLISEMTVAEKARLVIGGSPWCTEELPEYGIPKLFMLDSCNGLNLMEYESEFVYRDLEKQATAAGTPLDREKNGWVLRSHCRRRCCGRSACTGCRQQHHRRRPSHHRQGRTGIWAGHTVWAGLERCGNGKVFR